MTKTFFEDVLEHIELGYEDEKICELFHITIDDINYVRETFGKPNKDVEEKVKDLEDTVEKLEKLVEEELSGGYWNYRFIQKCNEGYPADIWYDLHEVYYDGAGNIIAITENPCHMWGEDRKDIKDYIKKCKKALRRTYVVKSGDRYVDSNMKIPKYSLVEYWG